MIAMTAKTIHRKEDLIVVDLGVTERLQTATKTMKEHGTRIGKLIKEESRPVKEIRQSAVSQAVEPESRPSEMEHTLATPLSTVSDTVNPTEGHEGSEPDKGSTLVQRSEGETSGNDVANDSASSTESAKNRYLKEHFAYVRDAIMKNLSYPPTARRMGWEGKVLISFVVSEDGHVSDIKVIEGSGFGILDRNAIETVKKASPFPKPPIVAELVIPIVYKLK